MKNGLTRRNLRKFITASYETMLISFLPEDPQTEQLFSIYTDQQAFDILHKLIKLNVKIVDEAIEKFFDDKEITERAHRPKSDGIDEYKIAGYLTFWLSKLKPIMVVNEIPLEFRISEEEIMYINEIFATGCAGGILTGYVGGDVMTPYINKDLKYTLRYRINTRNEIALIYKALLSEFCH